MRKYLGVLDPRYLQGGGMYGTLELGVYGVFTVFGSLGFRILSVPLENKNPRTLSVPFCGTLGSSDPFGAWRCQESEDPGLPKIIVYLGLTRVVWYFRFSF